MSVTTALCPYDTIDAIVDAKFIKQFNDVAMLDGSTFMELPLEQLQRFLPWPFYEQYCHSHTATGDLKLSLVGLRGSSTDDSSKKSKVMRAREATAKSLIVQFYNSVFNEADKDAKGIVEATNVGTTFGIFVTGSKPSNHRKRKKVKDKSIFLLPACDDPEMSLQCVAAITVSACDTCQFVHWLAVADTASPLSAYTSWRRRGLGQLLLNVLVRRAALPAVSEPQRFLLQCQRPTLANPASPFQFYVKAGGNALFRNELYTNAIVGADEALESVKDPTLTALFTAHPILWVAATEGDMLLVAIEQYRLPIPPQVTYQSRKDKANNLNNRYAWFPFRTQGKKLGLLHHDLPIFEALASNATKELDWWNNDVLPPSGGELSGFLTMECREHYDVTKPNSQAWDANQMAMMVAWINRVPPKSCHIIPPSVSCKIQALHELQLSLLVLKEANDDASKVDALEKKFHALFTSGSKCVLDYIYSNWHIFTQELIVYIVEETHQRWSFTVAVNAGEYIETCRSLPNAGRFVTGLHYVNPSQSASTTGENGPPDTNAFTWFLDLAFLHIAANPSELNRGKSMTIPCPLDGLFQNRANNEVRFPIIAFKEPAIFVEPTTYANSGLGVALNLAVLLSKWPGSDWLLTNRAVRGDKALVILDPRHFGLKDFLWETMAPFANVLSEFRKEYEIFVDRLSYEVRASLATKHTTNLKKFQATMETPLFVKNPTQQDAVTGASTGNEDPDTEQASTAEVTAPAKTKTVAATSPRRSLRRHELPKAKKNTRAISKKPARARKKTQASTNEVTVGESDGNIKRYVCADRSRCCSEGPTRIGSKAMKCWVCKKSMHLGCGYSFTALGRHNKPLTKQKVHRRCYYCENDEVPSEDDDDAELLTLAEGPSIATQAIVEKRREQLQGLKGIERMMQARDLADNNGELINIDYSEQAKFVDRQLRVWGWKTQKQFVDWANDMKDLMAADLDAVNKAHDEGSVFAKQKMKSYRATKAFLDDETRHHKKAVHALQREYLLTQDGIIQGITFNEKSKMFRVLVAYRSPRRNNEEFQLRFNVSEDWVSDHYGTEVCDHVKQLSRKQFDGFMQVLLKEKKIRNPGGDVRLGNDGEPIKVDAIRFVAKSEQWEGKSYATNEVFALHDSECSDALKSAYYDASLQQGGNDGSFVAIGEDIESPTVPILDDSPVTAVRYKPAKVVKLKHTTTKGDLTDWQKHEQEGIQRAYRELGKKQDPRATGHGFKRRRRQVDEEETDSTPKPTVKTIPEIWWVQLADGTTKVSSEDEIKMLFGAKYTKEVMHIGRNLASNRTYVQVPVGAVRAARLTQQPALIVSNAPLVMHQQGVHDTCVFSSFASALAFAGASDAARKIQHIAIKHQGASAVEVYKHLCLTVRKTSVNYLEVRKLPPLFDWSNDLKHNMLVVGSLQGSDGSVHHAVTLFRGWIFDSNEATAIPLTKAGLDFCTETEEESLVSGGPSSTFVRFKHGIIFIDNTKLNRLSFLKMNFAKQQDQKKNKKRDMA